MKRRENSVFNIAFLDLLSGALGAVIILYVAVPKGQNKEVPPEKKVTESKQKFQENIQQKLEKQIERTEQRNRQLEAEKQELKKKIVELQKQKSPETTPQKVQNKKHLKSTDVGFNFHGQKIVFVLDTSGSMYLEDRIGQVKAGLKMLITSMAPSYQIDVVVFPDNSSRTLYRALWGKLKKTTKAHKKEVYQFLLNIKPHGGTPTEDALTYALDHYQDASDIVLLSDGTPTIGNSRNAANIPKLLEKMKRKNGGRTQINTIGVGSDFLEDKDNKKYRFLSKLAKQHKGFFVGF